MVVLVSGLLVVTLQEVQLPSDETPRWLVKVQPQSATVFRPSIPSSALGLLLQPVLPSHADAFSSSLAPLYPEWVQVYYLLSCLYYITVYSNYSKL